MKQARSVQVVSIGENVVGQTGKKWPKLACFALDNHALRAIIAM